MTRLWQTNVLRVAAMNCADPTNDQVCSMFNIQYYPSVRLLPRRASLDKPNHDQIEIRSIDENTILEKTIDFIQNTSPAPLNWPDLNEFK